MRLTRLPRMQSEWEIPTLRRFARFQHSERARRFAKSPLLEVRGANKLVIRNTNRAESNQPLLLFSNNINHVVVQQQQR